MSGLTSSFTRQFISVIITTLIIHHSFTLSLRAQNLPFQQILPTLRLLLPWTAFTITGPDRTYYASRFISVRFLNFSVWPVWWTKLAARQLLTARLIHSIVSYTNTLPVTQSRLSKYWRNIDWLLKWSVIYLCCLWHLCHIFTSPRRIHAVVAICLSFVHSSSSRITREWMSTKHDRHGPAVTL